MNRTDAERLMRATAELRELYSFIQVLRSAATPPSAVSAQSLIPLIDRIDAGVRAALEAAEEKRS